MLSFCSLIVPGIVYVISNPSSDTTKYLKNVTPLDIKKEGSFYTTITSSNFNPINFRNNSFLLLISTRTIGYRKINFTPNLFSTNLSYKEISSQLDIAKSINGINYDAALSKLKSKYICTDNLPLQYTGMSMFLNTFGKIRTVMPKLEYNVYSGIPFDHKTYLVVGDYRDHRFIDNKYLRIYKDITINECISNSEHNDMVLNGIIGYTVIGLGIVFVALERSITI